MSNAQTWAHASDEDLRVIANAEDVAAASGALAELERRLTHAGLPIRGGVCLLCGSGVLLSNNAQHIRDDLDPCRGAFPAGTPGVPSAARTDTPCA